MTIFHLQADIMFTFFFFHFPYFHCKLVLTGNVSTLTLEEAEPYMGVERDCNSKVFWPRTQLITAWGSLKPESMPQPF